MSIIELQFGDGFHASTVIEKHMFFLDDRLKVQTSLSQLKPGCLIFTGMGPTKLKCVRKGNGGGRYNITYDLSIIY